MSKPTETELLPERMTLDSIPQAVYHVVRWYSETFERVPLKEEFEGIEAVLRQHFAPQPTLQQAIEPKVIEQLRSVRECLFKEQQFAFVVVIDHALATLESLASTQENGGWLPIESVPKDDENEDILLWIPDSGGGHFEIAFWRKDANAWDTMDGWLQAEPSHWMRPQPPKEA